MADRTYDTLIVGSGIGGLTAAITAKIAGLQPLLIEKLSEIGGSSAMSGGVLWLPNNPLMQREGIPDSREAALTYLANFVTDDDPGSTPERREAFVDGVGPLVAFYESQGVPLLRCHGYSDYYDLLPGGNADGRALEAELFDANRLGSWKSRFKGQNFPIPAKSSESAKMMLMNATMEGRRTALKIGLRAARAKLMRQDLCSAGAALQGRLLEVALRLGCEIETNAGLVELETEGGRVTGGVVDFGGNRQTILARHGVLIASGGFANNAAMRHHYQREPIGTDWTFANTGNTGETIGMMEKAGAALGWMDEAWWTTTFVHEGSVENNQIIPELHKPHIILVDANGERFVNEAQSYMEVGRALYARNETVKAIPAWAIFDSNHRRRYAFGFALPGITPKSWIEKGYMKKADSLSDLARQAEIDPGGLTATIRRWNAMAAKGIDEDFSKGKSAYNRYYADPSHHPNPCMGPIIKPPFYAAPLVPGDVGTCGGAVTDKHARVLREDDTVIDGLYATGNCTSPIAGPHYIGAGQSIGCSAVFGMLAIDAMRQ